ncbi:hypothetical protein GQ457_16G012280 [Hibiscus cannabinus]
MIGLYIYNSLLLIDSETMVSGLINANHIVYEKKEHHVRIVAYVPVEYVVEPIDQQETFDIFFSASE